MTLVRILEIQWKFYKNNHLNVHVEGKASWMDHMICQCVTVHTHLLRNPSEALLVSSKVECSSFNKISPCSPAQQYEKSTTPIINISYTEQQCKIADFCVYPSECIHFIFKKTELFEGQQESKQANCPSLD